MFTCIINVGVCNSNFSQDFVHRLHIHLWCSASKKYSLVTSDAWPGVPLSQLLHSRQGHELVRHSVLDVAQTKCANITFNVLHGPRTVPGIHILVEGTICTQQIP